MHLTNGEVAVEENQCRMQGLKGSDKVLQIFQKEVLGADSEVSGNVFDYIYVNEHELGTSPLPVVD